MGYYAYMIELQARVEDLNKEREKLYLIASLAMALIARLPMCDQCGSPATRAWKRGEARFCDTHGPDVPEYPRAVVLRALIKALEDLGSPWPPQNSS